MLAPVLFSVMYFLSYSTPSSFLFFPFLFLGYPTSPLQEVVTHPAADDNSTTDYVERVLANPLLDFSDEESSTEDGIALSNQVTRTVGNVEFSTGVSRG